MKKLHDRHYPAGLEWVILKKLPMVLLGGIFIPLFMSIIVRLFPAAESATEIAKQQTSIDILSVALFIVVFISVFTLTIGCVVVVLMKGPGYVADAYKLEDSDRPGPDNENTDA